MYYYSGIQLIELAKESQHGKPGELVPWNQALIQRVFNRFFGMWEFSSSNARTQDFKAQRGQDSGGGGVGGRLYLDVFCCLEVNGPVTGGTYKWGERGLKSREGDVSPDVSFCCCFTGKWTCNWGNL